MLDTSQDSYMTDDSRRDSSWGTERVVNSNFAQVNRDYEPARAHLSMEAPVANAVLHLLIGYMDKHNVVIISSRALEESLGKSRATISRATAKLIKDKWVQAIRVGSARGYAINERVAWTSRADRRKHAVFSATVVAARSEQVDKEMNFDAPLRQVTVVERSQKKSSEQGSHDD